MAGIFGIALRGLGMLGKGKKVSKTINSVKPNVPKTKLDKAKSKLAIAKQKAKGSKAKLNQTLFNIDQASKKAKEVAKDKRNERIVKKFIREEKADGGRIGRRLGGGADMAKKKTNIQKIRETFAPKNKNLKPVDKKKQKGLAKLPIEVRNKMGYAKKGGRA